MIQYQHSPRLWYLYQITVSTPDKTNKSTAMAGPMDRSSNKSASPLDDAKCSAWSTRKSVIQPNQQFVKYRLPVCFNGGKMMGGAEADISSQQATVGLILDSWTVGDWDTCGHFHRLT